MKNLNWISIFLICLLLRSCNDFEELLNFSIDTYPMTAGTEWTYERNVTIIKYETDSAKRSSGTETFNNTIIVRIIGDTILNDTMPVTEFYSWDKDSSQNHTDYKFIDNEGLKTYAYTLDGGSLVLAGPNDLSGGCFNYMPLQGTRLKKSSLVYKDTIYEKPPVLDVQLPLEKGGYWTYRNGGTGNSGWFPIDKSVEGTDRIRANKNVFTCLKVKLIHPNYSGIPYEITDWISESGLIKRMTIGKRVQISDINGEYNYYADFTEIIELTELKIYLKN